MSQLNTIVLVPTDLIFTCPMCAEDIVVESVVFIDSAEIVQTSDGRKAGPAEFEANVNSRVLGMRVEHNCTEYPDDYRGGRVFNPYRRVSRPRYVEPHDE